MPTHADHIPVRHLPHPPCCQPALCPWLPARARGHRRRFATAHSPPTAARRPSTRSPPPLRPEVRATARAHRCEAVQAGSRAHTRLHGRVRCIEEGRRGGVATRWLSSRYAHASAPPARRTRIYPICNGSDSVPSHRSPEPSATARKLLKTARSASPVANNTFLPVPKNPALLYDGNHRTCQNLPWATHVHVRIPSTRDKATAHHVEASASRWHRKTTEKPTASLMGP